MWELYNRGIAIVSCSSLRKRGFYIELILLMMDISMMPEFETLFRTFTFEWLAVKPGRYIMTLIWEFYVAYQILLKVLST